MRSIFCLLLTFMLMAGLMLGGSMPDALPLPPGRSAAWWGLLFPGLFSQPVRLDERVTFTWPLLDYLRGFFA